jgi:formylglycine-generating enzyme required for sulfatase activity
MMGAPDHEARLVGPVALAVVQSFNPRQDWPAHEVRFAQPFAVGRFAVTFEEWDTSVDDGGCGGYRPPASGWGRGRQPVINVSWDDAKAYVSWLSRRTGQQYRLLSEAEREYVTRAGTTTPFWWGIRITMAQASYSGFSWPDEFFGHDKPMLVDSFAPNPWGLYQVHGNVWDWIEDCWDDRYPHAPADGSARTSDHCTQHILRGGSWIDPGYLLRSGSRYAGFVRMRSDHIGFRVARTIAP